MVPPRPGATAPPALPPAGVVCDGGFRLRHPRKPPGVHTSPMLGDRLGFLGVGNGLGVHVLLGQLTGGHHHNAPRLRGHPPLAIRHVDLPTDAVSLPAAWRLSLRTPRLLGQHRPGGLLLPPRFECLPHRPGTWDQGHHPDAFFETKPPGPLPIRRTIGHEAADPLESQGETLLHGQGGRDAIARVAIPKAYAKGPPALATHPETQQHLLAIITAICTLPRGWACRPWRLRLTGRLRDRPLVLIGTLEGNRRGILMAPGRRDGIDLYGVERPSATHPVEVGGTQGLKDLPQAVIIERGTLEASLEPGEHPARLYAGSYLLTRMRAVQDGSQQRLHPVATGAPRGGMGWKHTIDDSGDAEPPHDTQDHGHMGEGMNSRHRHHPGAPPGRPSRPQVAILAESTLRG
jgi:hypothetical protein